MNKKILYGLAGALAVLTLTGCNKTNETKNNGGSNNKPVEVDKNTVYTITEKPIFLGDVIDIDAGKLYRYTDIVDGELEDLDTPIESEISAGEFSNKASDLTGNKKIYVKHVLDEDKKVSSTYGCIKEEGKEELCVIAYKNKEFENNKSKLEKYFEGQAKDVCLTEEGDIECDNKNIIISNTEDMVFLADYTNKYVCQIDFEQGASCGEREITIIDDDNEEEDDEEEETEE